MAFRKFTRRRLPRAKTQVRHAREKIALAKTPLGRVVTRIQKKVGAMKPELKHWDLFANSITINNEASTNNSIQVLGGITQGPGDFGQRIGDKIALKSLHIRGQFQLAAGYDYAPVRMVIWMAKYNPDGASSYVSMANEYFTSIVDNTNYAPFALKDWDNMGSFTTLYDTQFSMHSHIAVGATPDGAVAIKTINLRIPLKNKIVQFYNAGSTITRNNLFVSFYSSVDGAVSFPYNMRLTYTDV